MLDGKGMEEEDETELHRRKICAGLGWMVHGEEKQRGKQGHERPRVRTTCATWAQLATGSTVGAHRASCGVGERGCARLGTRRVGRLQERAEEAEAGALACGAQAATVG